MKIKKFYLVIVCSLSSNDTPNRWVIKNKQTSEMTTVGGRFGKGREGLSIVPSTAVETALSSVCLPLRLSFCISGKIVEKERINCSNCVTITLLIETPIKRKLYCNISRHIQVLRTVANIRHGCLPPFSLKRWVILSFSQRIN